MKNSLRLEEIAMFAISLYAYAILGYSWWLFVLLILAPDISMLGYLVNPKAGAVAYNIFHHKGVALLIVALGLTFSVNVLLLAGVILFAHASMDRIMGYGLKYYDSFHHTHLGWIGPKHKDTAENR